MAASSAPVFHEGQRVLVSWAKSRQGDPATAYSARVCELRTEITRGKGLVQTGVRCRYECGGKKLWHIPSEVSELDEAAPVTGCTPDGGNEESDDDACIIEPHGRLLWRKLTLRCCYSQARLSDPARCMACAHPSECNYSALIECMATTRTCPVDGCSVRHAREIVRDDALREAIAALPSATETCWLRGHTELRVDNPYARIIAAAPAGSEGLRGSKRFRVDTDALEAPSELRQTDALEAPSELRQAVHVKREEHEAAEEPIQEHEGATVQPDSGRAWILRALLSGCQKRADIVNSVCERSDFGSNTKDRRGAIVTLLGKEKHQPLPLWMQAGDEYEVTPVGKVMRGTDGFYVDDDEDDEEAGDVHVRLSSGRAYILRAILHGCCSRDEIVASVMNASDYGANARDQRSAIVTVLGKEKFMQQPLWVQDDENYWPTAAGQAVRGTEGFEDEGDEEEKEQQEEERANNLVLLSTDQHTDEHEKEEVRERDPSTQYTELEVGTDQLAQKHPPNLTGKDVCVMAAAFPSEQLITPNVR